MQMAAAPSAADVAITRTKPLDLDAYESAKLRLLPLEKTQGFMTVFLVFAAPLVLYGALSLLRDEVSQERMYEDGRLSNAIIADGLLVFGAITTLVLSWLNIYITRTIKQVDPNRNRRFRVALVIIGILFLSVPIAIS
jgi:hypothetical protein